jgi:hypothetical protein
MLRGINHVRPEAIFKRRDDHVVKCIGLIPSLLQDSGENTFSPLLLCEEHFPTVPIKYADHVGIVGWIRRGNRRVHRRRLFFREESF